jgi:protein-S-isoprenylcysteine O-methyltransferase Ste14
MAENLYRKRCVVMASGGRYVLGMSHYQATGYVGLVFAAFALIHSLLVTEAFKSTCQRILGTHFMQAHYRALYSIISIITFTLALYLIKLIPDIGIYKAPSWLSIILRSIQIGGIVFGAMAFKYIDGREFLGMRQMWTTFRGLHSKGDAEGITSEGFITGGVYSVVRNPLYFAGIVFFVFQPDITRTGLTLSIIAVAYFIWGAYIEQRRMLTRYGEPYRQYMSRVPLLIPRIRRNKPVNQ